MGTEMNHQRAIPFVATRSGLNEGKVPSPVPGPVGCASDSDPLGLGAAIERVAQETGFSGVVHVSGRDRLHFERAYGLADRAHVEPTRIDTQFGIASVTKGLTALAALSLVADRALALDTSVRDVLGDDRALAGPDVTVGHLLAHTSGIGDYLDEATTDVEDYVISVPVHRLALTVDYLPLLRRPPAKFDAGTSFEYCNSGYVILALVVEVVTGRAFHDVVADRVCAPAGMTSTEFLRSDELPGRAAIGYVGPADAWRTNHLHLPVRGSGDGGAYSTVGDLAAFWSALFEARIIPRDLLAEAIRPHHDAQADAMGYGLGFWLPASGTVMLEGYDAGVSCRTAFHPPSGVLYTVLSNTTRGTWPVAEILDGLLPSQVA